MLLVFVIVLAATYYFTKWMAGFQKERNLSGNIEVIETARISTTKYIQIVRIGSKYMAIAVGKDEGRYPGRTLYSRKIVLRTR